jgi:hypothetical protein
MPTNQEKDILIQVIQEGWGGERMGRIILGF